MILNPSCAVCGTPSALVEVLRPGELPEGYDTRSDTYLRLHERYHDTGTWRFRFEGIEAGNGPGDTISADRAALLIEVFTPPIDVHRLDEVGLFDDAGICRTCRLPYCASHWNVSSTGYGRCPEGHGKSLDPHWSPV